uniref:Uncharacterized protein n=1 Tax=Babesia duncani TaxID=323732 RepID=A0A385GNK9_9APIC|nr:hypothetical protein [Babesia duncani]
MLKNLNKLIDPNYYIYILKKVIKIIKYCIYLIINYIKKQFYNLLNFIIYEIENFELLYLNIYYIKKYFYKFLNKIINIIENYEYHINSIIYHIKNYKYYLNLIINCIKNYKYYLNLIINYIKNYKYYLNLIINNIKQYYYNYSPIIKYLFKNYKNIYKYGFLKILNNYYKNNKYLHIGYTYNLLLVLIAILSKILILMGYTKYIELLKIFIINLFKSKKEDKYDLIENVKFIVSVIEQVFHLIVFLFEGILLQYTTMIELCNVLFLIICIKFIIKIWECLYYNKNEKYYIFSKFLTVPILEHFII